MKLIPLLSGKGFVMYNKALAHTVSVNGSIIFGQLCSSYESFGSKNMLTVRDNKEYFFLTSGTLEEETALTYKQQLKAIKELEEAGYITTKVMGVPSKKFFHITFKIAEELLVDGNPSSDKKEDLKSTEDIKPNIEEPSLAQREILAELKGNSKPVQKGPTIKKKNKKEQNKNIKDYIVNKEPVNKDEIINKLISEYRLKGLSKEVCFRVLNEVNTNPDVENFGAYLRTCLENTLYKSKMKRGNIDFTERFGKLKVPLYNWLED
ncbi:hypothetical protein [Metabacillus idriensis]|uniref:hypothetical protein n=1 Tax=Metabacillus idriensis TaxID=324768 RepID=UPI00174A7514|nr:hypothetical protein [Metabacillus idriensis]